MRTALIPLAIMLTACPLSEANHPTKDDTAEPADGGTDGAQCPEEAAKIEALEAEVEKLKAELAACGGPK